MKRPLLFLTLAVLYFFTLPPREVFAEDIDFLAEVSSTNCLAAPFAPSLKVSVLGRFFPVPKEFDIARIDKQLVTFSYRVQLPDFSADPEAVEMDYRKAMSKIGSMSVGRLAKSDSDRIRSDVSYDVAAWEELRVMFAVRLPDDGTLTTIYEVVVHDGLDDKVLRILSTNIGILAKTLACSTELP